MYICTYKYRWTCLEYLAAFSYFSVFVAKCFALPSPRQQVNKETRIKNSAHVLNPRFGNMHFLCPAAQLKLSKWLMFNEQ